MKSRQTFYISKSISDKLKKIAYKRKEKISTLVDDALTQYLTKPLPVPERTHSFLKAIGKIKSFNGIDPVQWQKKMRSDWDEK